MIPVRMLVAVWIFAALPHAATAPPRSRLSQNGEDGFHREFGYVPMRDGVKIAYVVYRPRQEGRFPALLKYDPYASHGMAPAEVADYLAQGYAVIGANVRGSGCSEGVFSLFQPQEGEDGAQLIEWIGTQPWCTGSVGMIGNSYPGHTQLLTAARRPRHLKAIAAGGLTASIYREAFRPGGGLNVSFASRWTFLLQPASAKAGAEARIGWGDGDCRETRARQAPNRTFYDVLEHPLYDGWWKSRSLETYVDRIEVPTMIVQGWQDQQTASSGGQYLFQRLKTANKRMILQSGPHGVYGRPIVRREVIRWLDRFVKGEPNGVEKEPPVTVWWEVRDENGRKVPSWTSTFSTWPVPGTEWRTFHMTGDGTLAPDHPANAEEDVTRVYTYPSGTELVGSNVQFAAPPDASGVLAYRTAPMVGDLTILGSPQVTFHLSAEQADTEFMVTLHDIDANGDTLYLQRGFLRASMRGIEAGRSAPGEPYRPYNEVDKLVPGQVYEIRLSLPPLGHVIREGHRLELSIMAPSPIPQPDWGLLPVSLPGRNTVHHSARYPSRLQLPVVPGLKAHAPPPPCGSLELQPCRPAARPGATSSAR